MRFLASLAAFFGFLALYWCFFAHFCIFMLPRRACYGFACAVDLGCVRTRGRFGVRANRALWFGACGKLWGVVIWVCVNRGGVAVWGVRRTGERCDSGCVVIFGRIAVRYNLGFAGVCGFVYAMILRVSRRYLRRGFTSLLARALDFYRICCGDP